MTATILGGCMRLYAAGPEWHVDADHHTVGIDPTVPPDIDASGFLVFHTLDHNPIIAGTVASDETLTARGISGGISNGTFLIRIRLYSSKLGRPLDLNTPADWALVAGSFCNLWVTLIHDVPEVGP